MTREEAKQALAEQRPTLLKVAGRIMRANGTAADDAVQDAYLKALRAVEAGNAPRERGHLLAWFTKVVYSATYDALRSHARRKEQASVGRDGEPADARSGPLEQLIEREQVDRIDRGLALLPCAIERLPPQERRAVELRFRGLTNRQIATALGVPPGSVSAVFRAACERLRYGLGEEVSP
jgi:RNA polymerase sigma factor (sigma-70 family)